MYTLNQSDVLFCCAVLMFSVISYFCILHQIPSK